MLAPPKLDNWILQLSGEWKKGSAGSDGSTATDKSNVAHLGKSDCRRDLWANKLHKHNRIVSTRQTDMTASAWLADMITE